MNLNGFDANEVEPAGDFTPLPAGEYTVIITDSEEKATKSGNGSYLELKMQVVSGQYKDRNLWARLNLNNPNEQAVQIAKGELSAICRAVNVLKPNGSLELHNIPFTVKVVVKMREDNGEPTNEIKSYKAGTATESNSAPSAVASSNGAAPPWQR